jgi:hypothetical protein
MSAGEEFWCALLRGGSVVCKGNNEFGQMGDGTLVRNDAPKAALGIREAVDIQAGESTACARLRDGQVLCWGRHGMEASKTPIAVPWIQDATSLALGAMRACVVTRAGPVTVGRSRPFTAPVLKASAFRNLVCAVLEGGVLECAGPNVVGELGLGPPRLKAIRVDSPQPD